MSERRIYTGVGSRKTPKEILEWMDIFAYKLALRGWILRSGGAKGADQAFENGAFNAGGIVESYFPYHSSKDAEAIAGAYHNAWTVLPDHTKRYHGRNVMQVLGKDLNTPTEFVICWTPDGCIKDSTRTKFTGGTGTAISVASARNIDVFNLYNQKCFEAIHDFVYRDEQSSIQKIQT